MTGFGLMFMEHDPITLLLLFGHTYFKVFVNNVSNIFGYIAVQY